LVLYLNRF